MDAFDDVIDDSLLDVGPPCYFYLFLVDLNVVPPDLYDVNCFCFGEGAF